MKPKIAMLVVTSAFLGGCAGGGAGPLGLGAVLGDRNLATAEPLFAKGEEHCLGSADQLIDAAYGVADPDQTTASSDKDGKMNRRCEAIRRSFRSVILQGQDGAGAAAEKGARGRGDTAGASRQGSLGYTERQRNEVIDALIATSNRKCTRYAALLKNADGVMNASLSLGAILTGGLGAFVAGADTAKALAGTSAIFSGSRSALNEVYLSNLTIQVLSSAMEKARLRARRDITNRQACTTGSYTLMRGLEDAFAYHSGCSLLAGLSEAALSVERSDNPGLETMRRSLADYAVLVQQMKDFGVLGAPSAGSMTKVTPDLTAVVEANSKAVKARSDTAAAVTALNDAVETTKTVETDLGKAAEDQKADISVRLDAARKMQAAKQDEANRLALEQARLEEDVVRQLQSAASRAAFLAPQTATPETRQCPYGVGK